MENILFKVSFPAEFHAQTAVEASIMLHDFLKAKCFNNNVSKAKEVSEAILDCIDRINIETQEAGFRIIHKEGPLHNYADRDHCLQYMIAVGLVFGELKAEHYQDAFANHSEHTIIMDGLRNKMRVSENPEFTQAYFDPDKRAIPNSIQIFFKDGTQSGKVTVYYPLGHRQRREEALLPLKSKYDHAINTYFGNILGNQQQAENLKKLWVNSGSEILTMPIDKFVTKWIVV
jgi:2-methylcitrate dehydratase